MARKIVSLGFTKDPKFLKVLERIAARAATAKAVKVGILEGSEYPKTYSTRIEFRISEFRTTTNIAQVAFWMEFGTKFAPARPFMQTTVKEHSPRWGESMAYLAKTYNYDAAKILYSMGEGIQGQMRLMIQAWDSPPNSITTVKIKGFNKPLTDEGIMKQNVAFEVVK